MTLRGDAYGSGGWGGPKPTEKVRLTKEVDSLEELNPALRGRKDSE